MGGLSASSVAPISSTFFRTRVSQDFGAARGAPRRDHPRSDLTCGKSKGMRRRWWRRGLKSTSQWASRRAAGAGNDRPRAWLRGGRLAGPHLKLAARAANQTRCGCAASRPKSSNSPICRSLTCRLGGGPMISGGWRSGTRHQPGFASGQRAAQRLAGVIAQIAPKANQRVRAWG
jgi:hypothetical protein